MAANVAVGASRLGTSTRVIGAVGDDALGPIARAALEAEGVDHAFVATRSGEPTFLCLIMVSDEGEKSLVKVLSPTYLPRSDELDSAAFQGASHVHMTFLRPDLATRTVALARAAGATVSLDLEAADLPDAGVSVADLVRAVDVLFLSEASRREAERIVGPASAAGPGLLLTTRGRTGATLERAGRVTEVRGHAADLVDTTGAGDAFAAAFLHAWLGGMPPEAALPFANAAAALSTRAYGAQAGLATRAEVEAFLAQSRPE